MTNLQAMQDERLRDLIHQVEQLEKLYKSLPKETFLDRNASSEDWRLRREGLKLKHDLEEEIKLCKSGLHERWKTLVGGRK